MAKKLILVVVDAMHPGMLLRAVESGRAPTFESLIERGALIENVVSSFPSVTPVATSEITTGVGPGGHWIMGMNWYSRLESRYVEYGSSFEATRAFGMFRALYDLVYNMNLGHLSPEVETIFERLGDAGIRTACTPFLIYRGRQRHQVSLEGMAKRMAEAVRFRHAVWGPDELFYGDLYASRKVPCVATFSRPGIRDEYSTCVAEELIKRDLYEFMLLSLPDNDFHSHRHGPEGQLDSIAGADDCMARVIDTAGGLAAFLDANAALIVADHAQTEITDALPLADELGRRWRVLQPDDEHPEDAEIAVSPTSRAGAVYILGDHRDFAGRHAKLRDHTRELAGVDLIAWMAGPGGEPVDRAGPAGLPVGSEAVVERGGRELRFRPGPGFRDRRGNRWLLSGELETIDAERSPRRVDSHSYPDAFARLWSALSAPTAGDLLISAAEGYECVDWGGTTHIGGGSHGSLHRDDSLAPMILCGCGPRRPGRRDQWALRDQAAVILGHFGLHPPAPVL
ncbi:MAG: alkaline phosphatase family protein [Solirubrobacterales bacterium]